jgi:hypothetical protein
MLGEVMEAGDCRPWMKRKERGRNQCWEVTIVAGERPVHEEDEEGEESMLGVAMD